MLFTQFIFSQILFALRQTLSTLQQTLFTLLLIWFTLFTYLETLFPLLTDPLYVVCYCILAREPSPFAVGPFHSTICRPFSLCCRPSWLCWSLSSCFCYRLFAIVLVSLLHPNLLAVSMFCPFCCTPGLFAASVCCPLCRTPGLFAASKSLGCIRVLSSLLYSWSLCCTLISWLYLWSVLFVVLLAYLLHPDLLSVSVFCTPSFFTVL
jgi:hypothetical protein